MFAQAFKSTIIVSVVAFLATVKGGPATTTASILATSSQCDNGQMQCCNQVINSTSAQENGLGGLLGLLGIVTDVVGDIGLSCTPINILGLGFGAQCSEQAVCCTNVSENGLINLGCSPVDL